jgi:hypothetical protein
MENSFFGPNLVYTSTTDRKNGHIIGNNGEAHFANGQSSRDLGANSRNLRGGLSFEIADAAMGFAYYTRLVADESFGAAKK